MNKFLFILFLFSSFSVQLNAQWARINQIGGNPDNSAALQIDATDKGVLIPRVTIAERQAITNPAEGLLVYQNDSTIGVYYYNGTEWIIIEPENITNDSSNAQVAIVRDIKASGVDGGTFTAGAWQIRDLNDLRGDSSFITIDGVNSFTLDSGLYEISASAPARAVDEHQIRLYNVSDALVEVDGVAIRSEVADPPSTLISVIKVNAPTTFQIQHRCTSSSTTTVARGSGINWGINIYTQVRIQKL